MRGFFNLVLVSLLIYFGSWFLVSITKINTLAVQSEDTLPAMVLPLSIIKYHTLYADKFYYPLIAKYPQPDDKSYIKGLTPFYFQKIVEPNCDDATRISNLLKTKSIFQISSKDYELKCTHYISAFPIISGLLAVPIYLIAILLKVKITWEVIILLSHISSALIMALGSGFFYVLVRRYFDLTETQSNLLSVAFSFGTINYALISQALWQHGTLQLFLIIALIFMFESFRNIKYKRWGSVFLFGLFFGIAVLSRPTALIGLPFLFLLMLEKLSDLSYEDYSKITVKSLWPLTKSFSKIFLMFIIGILPAVIFFIWYNNTFFLSIANQGYAEQAFNSWLTPFPNGFLGLWFSPSKGILVYSPIFILMFASILILFRDKFWTKYAYYLPFLGVVLLHTLIMGLWKQWYGGWSFGYRMASDILPYLTLLLIPYIKSDVHKRASWIFSILLVLSISIQLFGIVFFDGIWHAAYDKGFKDTAWLWSLENSEIAFNTRRVLVKLDILDRACANCLPKVDLEKVINGSN